MQTRASVSEVPVGRSKMRAAFAIKDTNALASQGNNDMMVG